MPISVHLPKLIIEKGLFCDERVKVHARGRGKEGKRRTSLLDLEEVFVAVAFDEFHLCGMVSRDTGAFDHQSEYFVHENSLLRSQKTMVSLRQNRRHASYYSIRCFFATDVAKKLTPYALLRVDWVP